MILTLAIRNLFHDRIRLVVTLVGILFSIVLVAVQLGLFLGTRKMIIAMIEHARGELWVTAFGAKSFEEDGILLTSRDRHAAMATRGVRSVVSFAEWRKPGGGSTNVAGADPEDGGLAPWNVLEGGVDRSYLRDLGVKGVGDTAQIETREDQGSDGRHPLVYNGALRLHNAGPCALIARCAGRKHDILPGRDRARRRHASRAARDPLACRTRKC